MKGLKLLDGASWRVDGVGALVCLLMCAVAYLFGMRPLLEQHGRLAVQQAQLNAQRAKAGEAAANLLAAKKEQAEVHDWLVTHPLQLQPAPHANQRLASLTALANQAGASLDDVQPGLVTTGSRYDTFPIRLSGSGTYGSCAALLHRIRTTFPDMRVATLDLSSRPGEPGGPVRFRFDFLWYTTPAARSTATADLGR